MSFDSDQLSFLQLCDEMAKNARSFVCWVGAGLSREAGLPSWGELRDVLAKEIREGYDNIEGEDAEIRRQEIDDALIEKDYWKAFETLRNGDKNTFDEAVKRIIGKSNVGDVPDNYMTLWTLPFKGILSLNIDSFAERAYNSLFAGKRNLSLIDGLNIKNKFHLLKNADNQFLARLHGNIEDKSSWVLTKSSLNHLLSNDLYKEFIQSVLINHVVVFIGVSIEDIAVGGYLNMISQKEIDSGSHYLITHDVSMPLKIWCEENHVKIIHYKIRDSSHRELQVALKKILNFSVEEEKEKIPVVKMPYEMAGQGKLPSPQDITRYTSEEIRSFLNIEASRILVDDKDKSYELYDTFCKDYVRGISLAWTVELFEPENVVFGYKMIKAIANGSFGAVYKALDENGATVAIKLLHTEVRRQPDMLRAFRRGVKSMIILSKNKIRGMVKYINASEIPALIVMEYIEGPTLTEAVNNQLIKTWDEILVISHKLINIIREAHNVPEAVLHRDIRPQNIMLKDFYTTCELDVIVLDFDLSWHVGSNDHTILPGKTLSGFLSPEQADPTKRHLRRSALVDSFGLGMTLYFLSTGETPLHLEHMHAGWHNKIKNALVPNKSNRNCLPIRFARLIEKCTLNNQKDRIHPHDIQLEITLLKEFEKSIYTMNLDILAEEIISYIWTEHGAEYTQTYSNQFKAGLQSGITVTVFGDEVKNGIVIEFNYQKTALQDSKKIGRYLNSTRDQVLSIAKSHNWSVVNSSISAGYELCIRLLVSRDDFVKQAKKHIDGFLNIIKKMNFE